MPIEFDGPNSKVSANAIEAQSGSTITIQSGHNLSGGGSGLTPTTKTGQANKWKIVLIIKKEVPTGYICLKGVLQNKKRPNEYALMTSINKQVPYNYKKIGSMDNDYSICRCKMIAPSKFWKEFKNRLLY